jgi:hypothetical protein
MPDPATEDGRDAIGQRAMPGMPSPSRRSTCPAGVTSGGRGAKLEENMQDRRYADDRKRRRDLTGIAGGLMAGGVAGVPLGAILPGVGQLAGITVIGLFGALVGAIAGLRFVASVAVEDFDPNLSKRPYVGAHTPDASPSTG